MTDEPDVFDACSIPAETLDTAPPRAIEPGPGKQVLFFGDPMCSWCWGFSPELQRIAAVLDGRAGFHIIMGGLRPGTEDSWDASMRDDIRHHWQEVHAKTGQPFDFSRFEHDDFVYDTEPACRAVVAVRTLAPTKTLEMYEALQRGFYAENRDITQTDVLADIADTIGLNAAAFRDEFQAREVRQDLAFDFQRTRAFGVQGFPAVLCAEDDQYAFLALGYRPFDAMKDDLMAWLES